MTQTFTYAYDALGRRIAKTDAFGTTRFLWDGDQMVLEQRGGNETHTLYHPASFVPLAQLHNGHLHHLHTDHLGTPLEASNDAGDITWRVTYKTWGNVLLKEEEQITQNLRFQGQYFDQETGLHYNRFRYYDPGPGRFVSQDPIGLDGGPNLFSYAKNPVGWVDPLGLAGFKPCPCKCKKILDEMRANGRDHGPYNQVDPDSHHIYQNAAVRDLPGYSRSTAPAVQLGGPSTSRGSEHYSATRVQDQMGGGTMAAERRIAYKAMRRGGLTEEQAKCLMTDADNHFKKIGANPKTKTRIPGNRR